ncbi:phage tail protein [Methylohalobius crimeensis]|uniref:phage tail protein n=1 Tax=Methylohalobius crimeensis TaxID=244365 RepID=UPI0003B46ACD|nr:tail fiber protein [Methylohalobius crimeensis]
MADPFIGEIKLFAGNFAPRNYAFCDGQLMAIAQNQALFSLLGTTFGGDGHTTFAYPDMRGRVPIHYGTGGGLSTRRMGERGGSETVRLTTSQMPAHSHSFNAAPASASSNQPAGRMYAQADASANEMLYRAEEPDATLHDDVMQPVGGNQGHDNMMPSLGINFILSLYGTYPQRS